MNPIQGKGGPLAPTLAPSASTPQSTGSTSGGTRASQSPTPAGAAPGGNGIGSLTALMHGVSVNPAQAPVSPPVNPHQVQSGMQVPAGANVPTRSSAFNAGTPVSQIHTPQYSAHLLVPISSGVRAIPLNLSWTNSNSLTYHFTEHGSEFPGVLSETDDLAEAKAFWAKPITVLARTERRI
jgi:hypothetical protein